MTFPAPVYPGLGLALTTSYRSGPGTHTHNGTITASIVGTSTLSAPAPRASSSTNALRTLSVVPHPPRASEIPSRLVATHTPVPQPGSTVLARITRLQASAATCVIIDVDGALCSEPAPALLRREDVRGWETDRVRIPDSFRVGDIVRAQVLSVGDRTGYYLSTARNELGVVLARTETGAHLEPISWSEMRDPRTGTIVVRKVAKPI